MGDAIPGLDAPVYPESRLVGPDWKVLVVGNRPNAHSPAEGGGHMSPDTTERM